MKKLTALVIWTVILLICSVLGGTDEPSTPRSTGPLVASAAP